MHFILKLQKSLYPVFKCNVTPYSGGARVFGANVCFAAPPHQIGNIVTITMMVICMKLYTV